MALASSAIAQLASTKASSANVANGFSFKYSWKNVLDQRPFEEMAAKMFWI